MATEGDALDGLSRELLAVVRERAVRIFFFTLGCGCAFYPSLGIDTGIQTVVKVIFCTVDTTSGDVILTAVVHTDLDGTQHTKKKKTWDESVL